MAPAPSEVRIGSAAEMASARTRSTLADGRVVGWYGEPGVVVDAELATATPPRRLADLYGDAAFWERWTVAECSAKAHDVPIVLWLRDHGLDGGSLPVSTHLLDDVVVSLARVPEGRPGQVSAPADVPAL